MKKLIFFAAIFAAGIAVTGCSSDDDVIQEQVSLNNKFDAQGNAYVNIAINMPSSKGTTRANGTFDNGLAAEYDVKNAVLVLFKGSDESDATFNGAYQLTTNVKQTVTNEQISDRRLYTQQINKGDNALGASDHIYAFVIINTNGKFVVDENVHGLTVKAADSDKTLVMNTTTFSAFREYALNTVGSPDGDGLLMTNPPMSTVGGGLVAPESPNIKWMPELTAEHIYNSVEEAYTGTHFVEIYVERAAAKFGLEVPSGTSTGLTTNDAIKYDPSGIKWDVQNYNTNYYVARHVSSSYLGYTSAILTTPFYRFAESVTVDADNATKFYRIPWGEDANYTSAAPDVVPDASIIGKQVTLTKTPADAVFLAENTIDENSMMQEYTTRIVLAVPFNAGNSFYTSSLGTSDQIFSVDDMKAEVKAYIFNTHGVTATDVTFTNDADGTATVSAVTLSGAGNAADIIADLAAHVHFSYYKDGLAYYKVLIKHFGDVETPLRAAADIPGSTYNDVYPTANRAQNYLGRYSIVRNNWYQIALDGIKHIGKPSVPEIPADTPDDEIDAYLRVRINILSWGIRRQNVTL